MCYPCEKGHYIPERYVLSKECDNVRLCPVQDWRRAHAMHILLIGDKGKTQHNDLIRLLQPHTYLTEITVRLNQVTDVTDLTDLTDLTKLTSVTKIVWI